MSIAIWSIAAVVAGCASMLDLAAGRIVPAIALWIIASACAVASFHEMKTRAAASAPLPDGPLCHRCKKEPIHAAWSPACNEHCWQGLQARRGARRCDA